MCQRRVLNYSKDADKYFMQHSHCRHRFKIPKLLLRPAVAGRRYAVRCGAARRFIEMPLAHFNGAAGVHAAYAQSAECRIESSRVEQANRRASILQIFCYCSSANININAGIV